MKKVSFLLVALFLLMGVQSPLVKADSAKEMGDLIEALLREKAGKVGMSRLTDARAKLRAEIEAESPGSSKKQIGSDVVNALQALREKALDLLASSELTDWGTFQVRLKIFKKELELFEMRYQKELAGTPGTASPTPPGPAVMPKPLGAGAMGMPGIAKPTAMPGLKPTITPPVAPGTEDVEEEEEEEEEEEVTTGMPLAGAPKPAAIGAPPVPVIKPVIPGITAAPKPIIPGAGPAIKAPTPPAVPGAPAVKPATPPIPGAPAAPKPVVPGAGPAIPGAPAAPATPPAAAKPPVPGAPAIPGGMPLA